MLVLDRAVHTVCLRRRVETTGPTQFLQPRSNTQYYLGTTHFMCNELAEAKEYLSDIVKNRDVSEIIYVIHASERCPGIHQPDPGPP